MLRRFASRRKSVSPTAGKLLLQPYAKLKNTLDIGGESDRVPALL